MFKGVIPKNISFGYLFPLRYMFNIITFYLKTYFSWILRLYLMFIIL